MDRNTPSPFTLLKPKISAGQMGYLARVKIFSFSCFREWHIRLCDICGQAGTHVKCQHWKRSPGEWYCDVCGDIHSYSSTRHRKIGDRSMDLPCIDDDDDESSSTEDLDVNVCSVSDDEISYGTVMDDNVVGTRHTLSGEGSVEKLVRERVSPMRKRCRLSLECTSDKSPSFSDNKESHSKISQDAPSCSGTQFNDVTPEVLLVLSDTIFDGVVVTSQGSADMANECTSTSTKESETNCVDSDTTSEASVELIKTVRKPELLDLKRRPIAKRSKSENSTSSDESVSVASSESSSSRKQDLSTTTEKGGLDVVAADSRALSVKVEEGTEPGSEEVNLTVSNSRQDVNDSDEDSCIITNVVKKPCPLGNDKFGMKCYLECCNQKMYCDFHQFSTSRAKTKDLQITTVSSTSGTMCDHFKEKSSLVMEQNSLLDQASTGAIKEEKAQVCSVGTNTLPFKPSSTKAQKLPTTQATATQTLFSKGKAQVSSSGRNKRLNLRSKKSGSYLERSLKGFCSLREHNVAETHKC